jgi:hypothetical protein
MRGLALGPRIHAPAPATGRVAPARRSPLVLAGTLAEAGRLRNARDRSVRSCPGRPARRLRGRLARKPGRTTSM